MNLCTNTRAFFKMHPLSISAILSINILLFWVFPLLASPIDTTIFKNTIEKIEHRTIDDDVCANAAANVKGGSNAIIVKGITTGSAVIQVFNSVWTTVYNQQVSGDSIVVPNMIAGTYNVKVTVLGAGGRWPAVCSVLVNNVAVVAGSNPCDTDTEAPKFSNCPSNISLTTTSTNAIATWTAPTATDNCMVTLSVSSNFNSGFAFPIGTTNVVYTATDAKGNKGTCSFDVSVTQQQPTGGDICANSSANVKGGGGNIAITGITTSSAMIQVFNSAWTSVYNQQVSGSTATIPNLPAGNYNVKVTVLGTGGKWPAVCSVLVNNVVVSQSNPCDNDAIAPIFSNCPQNISVETVDTFATATWAAPSATDNCMTTPSVSSNYNSGSKFPIGSKTVTYTATDAKNNSATCSFIVSVAQKNNCRYSDSLVLVDVFNTMGGASWEYKWDLTQPMEKWGGVLLDSNGCVTLLVPPVDLSLNNKYKISPSIGNLKQLKQLWLRSRNIIDTIPSSLGQLANLRNLQFDCKNLTGRIPESFGNLTNLVQFYAFANNLTGDLPSSLGNLSNLRELVLFENAITGSIPSSFGNLKNLNVLILYNNKMSGEIPNTLSNLQNLSGIDLSNNLFSGGLPTSLTKIPNIININLGDNQFSGCIPDEYKALCGKNVNLIGNIDLPNNGDFTSFCNNSVGACTSPTLCQNDTIRPYFTRCPSNFYLKTNSDSTSVTWVVPNALDNCNTPIVNSNFKPNDKLPIGATNIVYTAIDAKGNKGTCEFKVVVAKNDCRQLDSLSLVDLFNSTSGNNWKEKWDLTKPIDTWKGIILDANGCVKEIYLPFNNLNGSLPQTIGNLTSLQSLGLMDSLIVGNLPSSLGNLSNLQTLFIEYAALTGNIPASLGNLKNLKNLVLAYTKLSGPIPNTLGKLNNLTQIFLVDNKLTGSIPPELGDLPKLYQLYLHTNQLDGCLPSSLKKLCGKDVAIYNNPNLPNGGNWPSFCNTGFGGCDFNNCRYSDSLRLVDLYNSMNGANWYTKWDLTKPINTWYGITLNIYGCVTSINLPNNNLLGTIPTGFSFNELSNLNLRENKLSGSIPNLNMPRLEYLYLNYNQLNGNIPNFVTSNLKELNLNNNQLSGYIPDFNFPNLRNLYLDNNKLEGSIPNFNLPNLDNLGLTNNRLSGCLPSGLKKYCGKAVAIFYNPDLPNGGDIESFCNTGFGGCDFNNCRYSDSLGLVDLYNSTNGANWIRKWNLQQPMTTWGGITLNANGCVTSIYLPEYGLVGTLPNSIGNFSSLESLSLNKNSLTGSIPNTIGNLSELQSIYLGDNMLTGSIPASITKLSKLANILIFNNQLTGEIPQDLASLKNLNGIYLQKNRLTGSIPIGLGNLNLRSLYLYSNQLSGCYPNDLRKFCTGGGLNLDLTNNPGLPNNGQTGLFCATNAGACDSISCLSDTLKPIIYCPSDIAITTSLSSVSVFWFEPTVSDNCGYPYKTSNYKPNDVFPIGKTTVVYTVTDAKNNQATCSFNVIVTQPTNNCRYTDSLGLVSLYNSTNGSNWYTKWDLTKPIDTWYGISVNENGCVAKIELPSNGLSGSLPNLNIANLTVLALHWNYQLGGEIPNFNLPNLTKLYLNNDAFTGNIPNFNLPNLTEFWVQNNKLSGSIPNLNLPKLEMLEASMNELSGSIPNFNLPSLKRLWFHHNQLSGNIPNFNLPNLIELIIPFNQLNGSIPNFNLPNIRQIALEHNQLSGSIPSFDLPNLENLSINDNQLGGCLPSGLKKYCGKNISISNNTNLPNSGDWPAFCNTGFGGCDFNNCRYSDSLGLVDLYNSTNGANWNIKWDLTKPMSTWYGINLNTDGCLIYINLYNNQLSGSIPNLNLPNLKYFNIDNNQLSGSIPNLNLPSINYLYLNNNQLSGNIPKFNMPNLEELWLGYNQLNGSIPDFNYSKLRKLELFNNNLTGSIPNFNLPNLEDLNISVNNLNGQIPDFHLPKLKYLYLSGNQLTGTLPNFNDLDSLEVLGASVNQLTGSIPNFTSPNINTINFHYNQLSGTIPQFNLPKLRSLSLYNNQLSGKIPLIDAPFLEFLSLNDNQLTGSIPSFNYPILKFLFLHNNLLSGCIPLGLKKYCGINASIYNNPYLPNGGDWPSFCSTGFGACNTDPDLALSIGADAGNYKPYTTVNYRIFAQNKGVSSMNNIKIQFQYPLLTVKGGTATPSVGTWNEYCSGGILCYEWTIPSLAGNTTATLDAPLFILGATNSIAANANLVTSTPTDVNATNNTATVIINPVTTTSQGLKIANRQKPTQRIPIVIQTVAPNPTEGDVIIELESIVEKEVRFDFYNTLGKVVRSEYKQVKKGENQLQFDFWNAASGIYFIQTSEGEGRGVPLKFVKM